MNRSKKSIVSKKNNYCILLIKDLEKRYKSDKHPDYASKIIQEIQNSQSDAFVGSFTSLKDGLATWLLYGDSGKGFSIKFKQNYFEEY